MSVYFFIHKVAFQKSGKTQPNKICILFWFPGFFPQKQNINFDLNFDYVRFTTFFHQSQNHNIDLKFDS